MGYYMFRVNRDGGAGRATGGAWGGGKHTDGGREGSFSTRSQAVQGGSMTRGGKPGWFWERKELWRAEAGRGSTTHAICSTCNSQLIKVLIVL